MSRWIASGVCFAAMMLGCSHRAQAPQQQGHSKVSLVLEQAAVAAGSQIRVGLQFATDPGWHIYWQNPGDSGEAPRVEWQLPAGVTAGALEWPTPLRMKTAAGTDYGYQGTTVLLSSFHIPKNAPAGEVQAGGDVRWLVCHDVCLPQRANVQAQFKVAGAEQVNSAAHELLQAAAQKLPRVLPATIHAEAASTAQSFRLTVKTGRPISSAEFFPAETEQIENGAPQGFSRQAGAVTLMLKRSEYLRAEPQHLTGIVTLNGSDSYLLDAPVRAAAERKHP